MVQWHHLVVQEDSVVDKLLCEAVNSVFTALFLLGVLNT